MATMQTHTANTASRGNPALDVLLSYPLMQAMVNGEPVASPKDALSWLAHCPITVQIRQCR
jgi:hypothetical protein